MNIENFTKTGEWQFIKDFLKDEFLDKPIKIKTDGKDLVRIATEVLASEIACKKLVSALRKFERLGIETKNITDSYK